MEQIYYIGECPVCRSYGRMQLYYNILSGKISAICEECELEFDTADDYKNFVNGHRDLNCQSNAEPIIRPTSVDEIRASEWCSFVKNY